MSAKVGCVACGTADHLLLICPRWYALHNVVVSTQLLLPDRKQVSDEEKEKAMHQMIKVFAVLIQMLECHFEEMNKEYGDLDKFAEGSPEHHAMITQMG